MSTMEQTPRPWWPYLAAALVAAVAACFLLLGRPDPPAPADAGPSASAARAHATSSPSSSPQPTPTPTPMPSPSSSLVPSQVQSTSAERSAQARVEQDAVEAAVAGLSDQQRREAEQAAERFIQAAHERAWDMDQQQWRQNVAETATEAVVDSMTTDGDWQSQSWADFVQAQGRTRTRVGQAQAQNVTEQGVEVAVDFTTETESEDPWVAVAPQERHETVVVDLQAQKVIERFSMDPAGGL